MAEEYKEYDLLPCPWCENPVHVEKIADFGYIVTCGVFGCDCPSSIVYPDAETAKIQWNNGNTFTKIKRR